MFIDGAIIQTLTKVPKVCFSYTEITKTQYNSVDNTSQKIFEIIKVEHGYLTLSHVVDI